MSVFSGKVGLRRRRRAEDVKSENGNYFYGAKVLSINHRGRRLTSVSWDIVGAGSPVWRTRAGRWRSKEAVFRGNFRPESQVVVRLKVNTRESTQRKGV